MVLRDASGNFVAGRSSCLQTHNLKAAGSNPAPATIPKAPLNQSVGGAFLCLKKALANLVSAAGFVYL